MPSLQCFAAQIFQLRNILINATHILAELLLTF